MTTKKEIYEDVLEEEPTVSGKEYDKWQKRLRNSIGWTDLMFQGKVYAEMNKKGKLVPTSDVLDDTVVYDVTLEDGAFTTESQDSAILLSYVVQINERLKRLEKLLFPEKMNPLGKIPDCSRK